MGGQDRKQTLLTFLLRTIAPLSTARKAELLKEEAEEAEANLELTKKMLEYKERIAKAKREREELLLHRSKKKSETRRS